MQWITEEKNSKNELVQFHVKVSTTRKGLVIPAGTPTVKSADGSTTYFQLFGKCLVAGEQDGQFSDELVTACKQFGERVTPLGLLNSALDLASRKLIEDEYREEGSGGVKSIAAALKWFASLPIEQMIDLKSKAPTTEAERNQFYIDEYKKVNG